ncbi:Hypothetical predicted protein [Xyrichtys novacula]|uniref:Uncharacterized protein n=1 Tax=Xyrichtys novacula TaxID=13765 RepID=A0AAV1F8C3_XYRNO|nr:Hypothetical predicted protein [Xyrichtys novacula]
MNWTVKAGLLATQQHSTSLVSEFTVLCKVCLFAEQAPVLFLTVWSHIVHHYAHKNLPNFDTRSRNMSYPVTETLPDCNSSFMPPDISIHTVVLCIHTQDFSTRIPSYYMPCSHSPLPKSLFWAEIQQKVQGWPLPQIKATVFTQITFQSLQIEFTLLSAANRALPLRTGELNTGAIPQLFSETQLCNVLSWL